MILWIEEDALDRAPELLERARVEVDPAATRARVAQSLVKISRRMLGSTNGTRFARAQVRLDELNHVSRISVATHTCLRLRIMKPRPV